MPEVTRRGTGELVRGVFQVLLPHQDGLRAKEVLHRIEGVVPPTEFEAGNYPNSPGVRRFEKTIRFSTIPAVKAGWLIKDKGQWTLSDEGRSIKLTVCSQISPHRFIGVPSFTSVVSSGGRVAPSEELQSP